MFDALTCLGGGIDRASSDLVVGLRSAKQVSCATRVVADKEKPTS
jgi:hypothetical protein